MCSKFEIIGELLQLRVTCCVYDVYYVKYEKAEIHRSAMMQNFRDIEKKKK